MADSAPTSGGSDHLPGPDDVELPRESDAEIRVGPPWRSLRYSVCLGRCAPDFTRLRSLLKSMT